MELRKNFGARIKELRLKSKLTQAELSEKVGIDAKHMSHIETGRSFPKADLLQNFARELNVDYNEMFNFSYMKSKKELIKEITDLLKKSDEKDVIVLYKMVLAYLK